MAVPSCRAYWIRDPEGKRHRIQCKFELKDDTTRVGGDGSPEAEDYKRECRVATILPSHALFHSIDHHGLLLDGTRMMRPFYMFWWLFNFVGHRNYTGGWFTYDQARSSIATGTHVVFLPTEEIDLLHFGEEWRQRWDRVDFAYYLPVQYMAYEYVQYILDYTTADALIQRLDGIVTLAAQSDAVSPTAIGYARRMAHELAQILTEPDRGTNTALGQHCLDTMGGFFPETFGASHLVKGPRMWHQKPYPMLSHPQDSGYGDDLGRRMSGLGLTGYSSCDECEVFLTHATQAKTYPRAWRTTIPPTYPIHQAFRLTNEAWQALSMNDKMRFLRHRDVTPQERRFFFHSSMYTDSCEEWIEEATKLLPFVSSWSAVRETWKTLERPVAA